MPRVLKDEDGRLLHVQMDEQVAADDELAVQGHDDPRVNGKAEGGALAPLLEPTPNELADEEAE
jgi:hypothetical protein